MRLSFRRTLYKRQVLIQMKSGRAWRGIFWEQTGPLIVLRNVEMLEPGTPDPIPTDGEVVIERSNVEFIQALYTVEGRS